MLRKRLYYAPDDEPQGGNPDEEVIVEKEGEILLKVDNGEEIDTSDPATGGGDTGDGTGDDSGSDDHADDFQEPDEYKELSREDLIKRHMNATQKLGEHGTRIGELEGKLKDVNLTPEEQREALKAEEVKILLEQERTKLAEMDPDEVAKEDLTAQRKIVEELRDEYGDKSQREAIANVVNSSENKKFKAQQKEVIMKDYEISAEDFDKVSKVAEDHYLEDGKLTERAYHHALIAAYGHERVLKAHTIKAEAKAREDIVAAQGKVQAGVDASGAGTGANYVNIEQLMQNPKAWDAYLEGLTPEQHDALSEKLKKKM